MGRRAVGQFLRLYVSPGTDHGCAGTIDPTTLQHGVTPYGVATSTGTAPGVPRNVDWFGVLENWTLRGRAPGPAVIATTNHYAPPFPALASKPICAYPRYPHYVTGDLASATSYRCRA
jgi:hypothetical protein